MSIIFPLNIQNLYMIALIWQKRSCHPFIIVLLWWIFKINLTEKPPFISLSLSLWEIQRELYLNICFFIFHFFNDCIKTNVLGELLSSRLWPLEAATNRARQWNTMNERKMVNKWVEKHDGYRRFPTGYKESLNGLMSWKMLRMAFMVTRYEPSWTNADLRATPPSSKHQMRECLLKECCSFLLVIVQRIYDKEHCTWLVVAEHLTQTLHVVFPLMFPPVNVW